MLKETISESGNLISPRFLTRIKDFFLSIADITQFIFRFFKEIFIHPFEINEILNQSFITGFKSIVPVGITSFIMGIVIVLQSRPALIQFGAGSYIPSMSALSIIREIGPLITALICGGNIGSSICAELGSMAVTEQIDAMEVSGVKPFKFLVVTRVVASTLIIPVLVIYADAISLLGSYVGANIKGQSSFQLFFTQVFERLKYKDIYPSLIKSFLFGFSIGIISCYKGFTSSKGTEGVGKATNSSVVTSLIVVIVIDMIIVQFANIFNYI